MSGFDGQNNLCYIDLYYPLNKTTIDMAKNEVRIYGVSEELKNDLIAIAENTGITLTALLKPKLREIRDSYPSNLRKVQLP